MATEIRQLYDTTTEDSVNIMPITTIDAVRDSDGNSLETLLESKANASDIPDNIVTEDALDEALGDLDLGGGTATGLSNDHITIDNDKIYTLANKTARGNVFDGLVAFMRMTAFGQIEQCWINKALKKAGASGEPYIVWDPDDDRETSINFYNTELPDRVYILYWCTSNEYDIPNVYKTVGYQQIYGVRERGSSKGVWLIFDRDYYF